MRRGKKHHVLPSIIYAAVFSALCISSWNVHESTITDTIFGGARVKLSSGVYAADSEELTAKLRSTDINMLGHFSELREADFRGSSCENAIAVWADNNPGVRVVYSVTMPDGSTIDSDVSSLDLSGCGHSDMPALETALTRFKNVSRVSLGVIGKDASSLQLADMKAVRELLPEAEFDFKVNLQGKEISPSAESLDLTALESGDAEGAAAIASLMPGLKTIAFGDESTTKLSLGEIAAICEAAPQAKAEFTFTLYGTEVSADTEALDFSYVTIGDKGEKLSLALPVMKKCRTVDLDSTGLTYEEMEKLRDEHPDTEFIWRIWFGKNYSVRTDTEKILASKPTVGGEVLDDTAWRIKYCTKLKYLDLGHNESLRDFSFVSELPELEVLIIAMTDVRSIDFLENCPKLNYLELNTTEIDDISALANCTQLKDLNIAGCPNLKDITALYDLDLDRLWIGLDTPIPQEQIKEMRSRHPNCNINTTTDDPHGQSWRYSRYDPEEPKYWWVPRYEQLRAELGYDYQEYSFFWLDKKCREECPIEFKGMFGKEVYG